MEFLKAFVSELPLWWCTLAFILLTLVVIVPLAVFVIAAVTNRGNRRRD